MLIITDPSDNRPIYQQIVDQVTEQVHDGMLTPGTKLPSAAELAPTLDLNRNTVLQAYRTLRDNKVLELRRGRGAIVLAQPERTQPDTAFDSAVDHLASLARSQGISLAAVTEALARKGLS